MPWGDTVTVRLSSTALLPRTSTKGGVVLAKQCVAAVDDGSQTGNKLYEVGDIAVDYSLCVPPLLMTP